MLFQRYVPCKGSNANVVRCIYSKERKSMQVYRIQTTHKMSGHVDEDPGSPGKRGGNQGNNNDPLYMTREKVISYAKHIIKNIVERVDLTDDTNKTTIGFGLEQVLLHPTVEASFDIYGQATGSSSM